MSAFMVSESHIDAIVAVAIGGPKGRAPMYPGDGWSSPYFRGADGQRDASRHETATYLGRMLASENARSLVARYGADHGMGWPVEDYRYPVGTAPLGIVETLKALDCYEYQTCEHRGWGESAAREFCESLRSSLIGCLPGYDDADWTVKRDRASANVVSIFDL